MHLPLLSTRIEQAAIFLSLVHPCESFREQVFVSEMQHYLSYFSNADVSPLCREVVYSEMFT